jgi:hypothetical protein
MIPRTTLHALAALSFAACLSTPRTKPPAAPKHEDCGVRARGSEPLPGVEVAVIAPVVWAHAGRARRGKASRIPRLARSEWGRRGVAARKRRYTVIEWRVRRCSRDEYPSRRLAAPPHSIGDRAPRPLIGSLFATSPCAQEQS